MSRPKRSKQEYKADGTPKRGYGEGWLIPPGNGYRFYTAAWKETVDGASRIRKKSTGTTDMDEATKVLDRIIEGVKARRVHDYEEAERESIKRERKDINAIRSGEKTLAVRDAMEALNDANTGLGTKTLQSYASTMRGFVAWLDRSRKRSGGASVELRQIGMQTVLDYLDFKRQQGTVPVTRKTIFLTIKGVFKNVAAAEERCKADRAMDGHKIGVTLPWPRLELAEDKWWTVSLDAQMPLVFNQEDATKAAPLPRKAFTLEELHKVLKADMDEEMRLYLRIGAQTGMRPGDAAMLKVGDAQQVRLDEGKTGRLIFVPSKTGRRSSAYVDTALGQELHDLIAKLPHAKKDGAYLMPTIAATYQRDPSRLARLVNRVLEQAGFDTRDGGNGVKQRSVYSYYSFRMTVARFWATANLSDAAAALGHSRPGSTTRSYAQGAKLEEDREAEAAAWDRWYHSIDGKAAGSPQNVFAVRAGEVGRDDVEDAQKPVYDAVATMLQSLKPQTLRAIASEALRLAMANTIKAGAKAAS